MISWHEQVKLHRKQLRLTQVQVVWRLGVTRMHYVQVENGKTNPAPRSKLKSTGYSKIGTMNQN